METQYLKINPKEPEADVIAQAAKIIEDLELVAFPTETVYGLGASAYYPEAVNKIFIAKQRPAENPLLVHVSNLDQVKELVPEIPPVARLLMDRFWPGPLSLVLPALPSVPSIVRGGNESVGIRMPDHPVALALIEAAGPLAAPSANLSGRPSPVTADHVRDDLDGRIAAVLDAGPTGLGMESTIIDFSQGGIRLVRRGALALETLEEAIGEKIADTDRSNNKFAHHQISAEIIICEDEESFLQKIEISLVRGRKLAVVFNNSGGADGLCDRALKKFTLPFCYQLELKPGSSNLYSILREAEQQKAEVLIFAPLSADSSEIAASYLERIRQAAQK